MITGQALFSIHDIIKMHHLRTFRTAYNQFQLVTKRSMEKEKKPKVMLDNKNVDLLPKFRIISRTHFYFIFRDFITECFKPSPRRPYEIPWEQKALWALLFGFMLLIGIIGNCIVIWIVLGRHL